VRPRDAAIAYAERLGWAVFPCSWHGNARKRPLTRHGFHDATLDRDVIREWWRRWPEALVGVPTGRSSAIVLDIDRKNGIDGFDTLDELGAAILPETPLAHTASGGLHVYFRAPASTIRNTAGARGRGLGRGLDLRGDGGYVIAPSPGSGYSWDPFDNLDTAVLAPLPAWALPREPNQPAIGTRPCKPITGLSPYAEAALDSAARRIMAAPGGQQEATLNGEAFAIGTLAGGGAIPPDFAREVLIWAARQLPSCDPGRPWRQCELDAKVERAFAAGMRHPRAFTHA
jgi:putative DNA primase/helicase